MEPRVWDLEARLVDPLTAVEEQVEVDRPRPVAGAAALAAELPPDLQQELEQNARRQLGVELRDRVQEPRLILVAPRVRLDDRREPVDADQLGRCPDRRFAVAEIRTEPDVGDHGRSTVAALYSTLRPAGRLRTRTRTRSGRNRS